MPEEPIRMIHPDLPGQEIWVVNPEGVPIHRQSGWQTNDESPKKTLAPRSTKNEE